MFASCMLVNRRMKLTILASCAIFAIVWFALPNENNAEVSKGAKGPKVTDKVIILIIMTASDN